MPRKQRQLLVDRYTAGNKAISKAYLGDEEALFHHDIEEYEEYRRDYENEHQLADKIILNGEIAQLRNYIRSLKIPEV